MKSYEITQKIAAPAAEVVKIITTAEYAQKEALLDSAFEAKSRIEQSGATIKIITDRVDPSRAPNGKLLKDKKEKSTVTSEWNIDKMRSEWSTKAHGMEKIVKISGTTWIEKDGESACLLREKGSASIGIPIIGDVVAKAIVEDIKKMFPDKAKLIEGMLKQ